MKNSHWESTRKSFGPGYFLLHYYNHQPTRRRALDAPVGTSSGGSWHRPTRRPANRRSTLDKLLSFAALRTAALRTKIQDNRSQATFAKLDERTLQDIGLHRVSATKVVTYDHGFARFPY